MFDNLGKNSKIKFYELKQNTIENEEKEMGIKIPKDLKELYMKYGYGFIVSEEYNTNRIMDPKSIKEFRTSTGQFIGKDGLDIYEKYEKDKIVFFEVNESNFLLIGFAKKNEGMIYYYDKKIADNLAEFFNEYLKDENYYME